MYKIDLHTHSAWSPDGGITKKQYIRMLEKGILDCIAITDHNETRFARALHNELGDKIIIGEEIKTLEGEIIGLFLTKTIPPGLSAKETVFEIRKDGGLIYIPHPFEKSRESLQEEALQEIIESVDIIEVFNGRGIIRGRFERAIDTATSTMTAMAASSDAHCRRGLGTAYSLVREFPDRETLVNLLKNGEMQKNHAPLYSLLCPGVNRIKNKIFLRKHI